MSKTEKDVFINKMMELGAEIDRSDNAIQTSMAMNEARKIYDKHCPQPLNLDVKVDNELNIVEKPNIHKLDYNEAVSLNSEWNNARTIRERLETIKECNKDLVKKLGSVEIRLQAEKKENKDLKDIIDNNMESIELADKMLRAEKKKVEGLSKKVIAGYLFNGRYYKSLHELRGKTMSEDNCATTLYY